MVHIVCRWYCISEWETIDVGVHKGFKLSQGKINHIRSHHETKDYNRGVIRLDIKKLILSKWFKYIGSILSLKWDINQDAKQKMYHRQQK